MTKPFTRFASREGIADAALCEVVRRAEAGLIDADLGGGVVKLRLARKGRGKSGGFRVIVLFRRGARTFFVYGFAKSDRDNIRRDELRAFRNLEKYDPSRSFKTWLLSIASHFCIDLIRKRRMSFLSLDEFLPSQWLMISDDDSVEDEAINRERRDWLQEMLTNLRPEERAIIVLRYWHDLSYEEIAQTLDTNRGVIKSRLFRARQALANQLHVDAIVNNFAPVMG